jgi:hypothetical protein
MNKKLYQYILIIIGLFVFIIFIWLRFIRERLPKNIPLNLSILGFCILLGTCSIFIYIIISLFRESKPIDPLLKQIFDIIYVPLKTLDHYIKDLSYTNNTYKYGINFLAYILGPLIIDSRLYYYIFEIVPRLILLTTLHIDVFWFNKLYYIYKVLLIGIFIFVGKYIIYSFKYAKEHFIESFQHYVSLVMAYEHASQVIVLDAEEDDDIPPTMNVPLPIFIEFQTNTFMQQGSYYDYMQWHIPYSFFEKNIPRRDYSIEDATIIINNILKISLIIDYYQIITNNDKPIKDIKKLIYINYLLCWSYILIVSIPSFYNASFWELWFIFNLQDIQDPFSLTDCPSILNEIIKEIYADE